MKKKVIFFSAVCVLIAALSVLAFAGKPDDDLTFGDAQDMLKSYMKKNKIPYEIGTEEFMQFAIEQTAYDTEPVFASHPDCEYMLAYLNWYRKLYFDYQLCLENFKISTEAGEELFASFSKENPCLVYNKETKELSFVLTKEFLNTTFAEYRDANFEKLQ